MKEAGGVSRVASDGQERDERKEKKERKEGGPTEQHGVFTNNMEP